MLKINFSRLHFTEYRENKHLNDFGFVQLKNDIQKVKSKEGFLYIEPYGNEGKYKWDIRTYFGKLIFVPKSQMFQKRFYDFRNSILSLVRQYGILNVTLVLKTNRFHKNKEITEMWGYRLILLDKIILLDQLNSEVVYNRSLENTPVDYHTVYCGPDGKIYGWDKI